MEEYIIELIKILQDECQLLKKILTIQDEFTNIIVNNRLDLLSNMNGQQKDISNLFDNFEGRRLNVIKMLSYKLGVSINSIDDLISNIPQNYSTILIQIKNEFTDLIKQVKQKSTINQNLLNNSLEYIDFMVNFMSNSKQDIIYSKEGKEDDNIKSLFDIKL